MSFHSLEFKLTLTVYLPFLHLSFVLVPCINLSSHTTTASLHSIAAHRKNKIWWVKIWKVIMLSSLARCFELPLCIAKWRSFLPPTPPNVITRGAAIRQSYLCINEWKPKERKFAFLRRDLKVLVSFAQGQVPFQAPSLRPSSLIPLILFCFVLLRMNFILSTPSSPEAMVSMQTHHWKIGH